LHFPRNSNVASFKFLQVAALFGDARRALDICRRATELVDQSANDRGVVKMAQVDAALQEMYSAPKIVAVRFVSSQIF
jgi:Cdc6-like AAA superfamily ATPase